VFLFGRPQGASVAISAVRAEGGATVRLLGTGGELRFAQKGEELVITLPARYPEQHVYALKITPAK
jgi:hypothetical protein